MNKKPAILPMILSVISAILLLISLRGGGTVSNESISAGENTAIAESNGLAENTDIAENTVASEASQDAPIRRLDESGYLYYMDYDKDYYSSEVRDAMRKNGLLDPGCSSFAAYNTEGELISCRNYDYPHRMSKEDRSLTGLNIIIHCKPEGKYESIGVADAIWCDEQNPLLRPGGPDQKEFDLDILAVLPYECMDGINEKGLHVAVLRVDIKEGDQPARMVDGSGILLRYMLDDCANTEEAIKKVSTSIVTPQDWQNCHFFVNDASGRSVVIESRNGEFTVVDSDLVTNFYLSYDDMEDVYKNGELREEAVMLTDENGGKQYKFGYGHGYHRFLAIATQLDRYRARGKKESKAVMPEETALVILQSVVQNPNTNAMGISYTQYSAIYNNDKRTVKVWPFQNYSKSFTFDVTGKQLNTSQ